MIMDWLRSCYQTRCHPYNGSSSEVTIRWFFCDPGAQPFPFEHSFYSLNWEKDSPNPVGEVPGAARPYYLGTNTKHPAGDHFCGEPDWFADGQPVNAPAVVPDFCCGQAFHGAYRFRGKMRISIGPKIPMAGRIAYLGNDPIYTGPYLEPGGRIVLTGNIPVYTGGGSLRVGGSYRLTGETPAYTGPVPSTGGRLDYKGKVALTTGTALPRVGGRYTFKGNVTLTLDDMLPGMVVQYGGSSAPAGYLLCDGSSVLRSTYAALFAVIGTTFGSVDGTHFNVPDFRRRVPMGAGGTKIDGPNNTVGSVGGEEQHQLVTAEIPAHAHTPQSAGFNFIIYKIGGGGSGLAAGSVLNVDGQTSYTGGDGKHNNVQPSLVVNYLIKT